VITPLDVLRGFLRGRFVWTLPRRDPHRGTDSAEFTQDGRMRVVTVWAADRQFRVRDAG
jgi:hypothetical protein